jgi:hypothetical protein
MNVCGAWISDEENELCSKFHLLNSALVDRRETVNEMDSIKSNRNIHTLI